MTSTVSAKPATFTRVAEVWIPEGDRLVGGGGAYGDAEGLRAASAGMSFGRGEGLPGRAWAEGRPIILKGFDGSYFMRTEAAGAAGLTCAVAVPVFAGRRLKAVLVILCGEDAEHRGAIEVWEEAGRDVRLADGYYGTAASFEAASRDMAMAKGKGLPGGVFSANRPILMRDLSRAGAFLRAEAAGEIGLRTGLGLPVPVPGAKPYVLTLLSAADTPIARRFEIWDARPEAVGASRGALRIDGICEIEGALWPQQNPPVDAVTVGAWQGPVGQVLGSGLPVVHEGAAGLPKGYALMVALPVYHDTELAHVVAWYL